MNNTKSANVIQNIFNHLGVAGYVIKIFDVLNSTNTFALDNITQLADKTIVIANVQTNGHGRHGRIWHSRPNADITMSIVRHFAFECDYLPLSLVVCLGVSRGLTALGIENYIKWPNDILLPCGVKMAGILLESYVDKRDQMRKIVIGVGCNCSLNRDKMIGYIMYGIDITMTEFLQLGIQCIKHEWLNKCCHYRKYVDVYANYPERSFVLRGKHVDITDDNRLTLELNDIPAQRYDIAFNMSIVL